MSLSNELSGVLLRRFKKKEMGWQRLWVVYSNFSLFFFKRAHDEKYLANLPIIGYKIDRPGADDAITKEFVFKLSYKSHIYFFAADSQYSLERWMNVIRDTSCSESRN